MAKRAQGRVAVWSLGTMRALVTSEPEADGGGLWWPVRGELVCDTEQQLLIARLGDGDELPGDDELRDRAKASRAWWRYRGRKPDKEIRAVRIDPAGEAETLGEILHILYDRWNGKSYIHKFKKPRPYLLEYENGQLWIAGGGYRVGPAGIIG